MPYSLSLQEHLLPEFFVTAPQEWERRLREISPVHEKLDHLRFRFREPHENWHFHRQGVWELYACTPRALVEPERAEQFRLHWSELPKSEQPGRRAMVSNYQHYMWHSFGVEARRFWVLQGEWGGTAASYTRREVRYLDAAGALSEPFPLGFFPPIPFNERVVAQILKRDRLLKVGNNFDKLVDLDRPEALRAEDDLAEREFRSKYLDTLWEMQQPAAEYMKTQLAKAEMSGLDLPKAPDSVGSTEWKSVFLETGVTPGATLPGSKTLQVAVR